MIYIFGFTTAVLCYIGIVIIFCVVYFLTPKKYIWFSFVVVVLLLSVLAYNLVPVSTDDLVTYYHHINVMREDGYDGLQYTIEQDWFSWKTFRMGAYYCYFISLLPSNSFLPFFNIFICYGTQFYVVYTVAKRLDIGKGVLFIASFIIIAFYYYYDVWSGTRNGVGFAIMAVSIFQILFEQKRYVISCIGLIVGSLMHSSAFAFCVVLFLVIFVHYLISKLDLSKFLIYSLVILGYLFICAIVSLASETFNISFLSKIASKLLSISFFSLDFLISFFKEDTTAANVNFLTLLTIIIGLVISYTYVDLYEKEGHPFGKNVLICYEYLVTFSIYTLGTFLCGNAGGLLAIRLIRFVLPQIMSMYIMFQTTAYNAFIKGEKCKALENNRIFESSVIDELIPYYDVALVVFTIMQFAFSVTGTSLIYANFG